MKQRLATSDVPEAIPANILDVHRDDLAKAIGSYKPGKHTLDDLAPAIPTLRKASGQRPKRLDQQKRVTSMPVFTMKERRQLDIELKKNSQKQKTPNDSKTSITKNVERALPLPPSPTKEITLNRRVFTDICASKKQLPPTPTSIKSEGHVPTLYMPYHTPTNIIVDHDNDFYDSMHSSDDDGDSSSLTSSDSDCSTHFSAGFSNRYSTTASSAIHTNGTSILHRREESEYSYNAPGPYTSPYLHSQYSHFPAPLAAFAYQSHYPQERTHTSPIQKMSSPEIAPTPGPYIMASSVQRKSSPIQDTHSPNVSSPIQEGGQIVPAKENPSVRSIQEPFIHSDTTSCHSFRTQDKLILNPVKESILLSPIYDCYDTLSVYAPAKIIQTYLEKSPPVSSEYLPRDHEDTRDTVSISSFDDSLFSSDSALVLDNKNSSLYEEENPKSIRSLSPVMVLNSAVILSPAVKITRSLTVRPKNQRNTSPNVKESKLEPKIETKNPSLTQFKTLQTNTEPKQSYLRPFRESSFLPVSGHFSIPPVEYLDRLTLNPLEKDFEQVDEYRAPLNLPKVRKIVSLTQDRESNSKEGPAVPPKLDPKPRPVSFSLKDLTTSMKVDVRNRLFSHCLDSKRHYKQYTRYFTPPNSTKNSINTSIEPTKIHDSYYKSINTNLNKPKTTRLVSLKDPNSVPSLCPPPTGSYFLSTSSQKETNPRSNRFRRYVSNIA